MVSFRLGGTDGVSIESSKWVGALETLGHTVRTVAGEGPVDVTVPGLAIGATEAPTFDELRTSLDGADLVIVENLASLPLNVAAREVLYDVLEGRLALFHHHDLAWQREHLRHLEGPKDSPTWSHVTINELSRSELLARGIETTTLMNSFDCSPPQGNRDGLREQLAITDEHLILLPTRAIPRKNIEGALALAQRLDAVFWLLGPAEDGYDATLDGLLRESTVRLRRGLPNGFNIHDAYAACDLVVMPSTWEGFGNPVLESVTHRRPLALFPYPVAKEITAYGFNFFDLHDDEGIQAFLTHPNSELLEGNLAIAREHFNVEHLPAKLATLLNSMEIS